MEERIADVQLLTTHCFSQAAPDLKGRPAGPSRFGRLRHFAPFPQTRAPQRKSRLGPERLNGGS